ncbi:MAG TPA: ORF6N domain-containing protein [Gemmatimonadaceae bacterium]|nr:ORF6N domain-containing protein [Gemmatimonadaceae bacterium]
MSAIHVVRGQRVMLDADLAALFRVSTGRLNEQVKRNRERFPEDFMFQLVAEEAANLKSQFAISSRWGGRRTPPAVFTEHGIVMLANVLRSRTAVDASIHIVRAFVHLRTLALTHAELSDRLDRLEHEYDARFKVVFDAIRGLMTPAAPPHRRIGFHGEGEGGTSARRSR